jgi:predicted PurR-regulated permease PerM
MEKWTRLLIVLATTLLLLAFVGLAVRMGMWIHHTLLIFALGGLVAYALDPLVELLGRLHLGKKRHSPSRELRVLLVVVSLLLLVVAAVWSLGGHLVAQLVHVQQEYPSYYARALDLAQATDQTLAARGFHFSLVEGLKHPPAEAAAFAGKIGHQVLPILGHFFVNVGESVLVLLVALYFLIYGPEMRDKFNALLPAPLRTHADLWETDVDTILGGFVRGQLLIALAMGAAAAVVCLGVGIRPWLLIGLLVTVSSLIPVFGPFLGALPAIGAALIGPTHFHNPVAAAVVVTVLFVIINELGSKVLYPKLVGAALGLHTLVVLFVLLAGLEVGGVVGVLFAAPMTALVIVTAVHLYRFWQELPDSLLSAPARREGDPEEGRQPGRAAAWLFRRRNV